MTLVEVLVALVEGQEDSMPVEPHADVVALGPASVFVFRGFYESLRGRVHKRDTVHPYIDGNDSRHIVN